MYTNACVKSADSNDVLSLFVFCFFVVDISLHVVKIYTHKHILSCLCHNSVFVIISCLIVAYHSYVSEWVISLDSVIKETSVTKVSYILKKQPNIPWLTWWLNVKHTEHMGYSDFFRLSFSFLFIIISFLSLR